MDCIFLRTPSEADYVKALWEYTAQNTTVGELTVCREYLMESKPFLLLPWPPSGRKYSNPEAEFSQKGQFLVPPERHPRDSRYAAEDMNGYVIWKNMENAIFGEAW
jgi:hypothetical protein